MKQIQFIQRCKCGAITIKFSDGASNSMFWETFEGSVSRMEAYIKYL